jgi:hypothetical protein
MKILRQLISILKADINTKLPYPEFRIKRLRFSYDASESILKPTFIRFDISQLRRALFNSSTPVIKES